MSLATQHFWNSQRDALKRIRDDLSTSRAISTSPADLKRQLLGKYSLDVTEYPRYRRATPPHLPRLSTPPSNEKRRDRRKLHAKRFPKVPPVVPQLTFPESTSDDSWGENSDDDSDATQRLVHQPLTYPLPYFMPQPTMLYPPQPIAVYYPAFPQARKINSGRKKKKTVKLQSALKKTETRYDPFDEEQNPLLRDYKYITVDAGQQKSVSFQSPLFEAYSPSVRGDYSPRKSVDFITDLHPFDFFLSQSMFADEFIDDFVDDCIIEEYVPDLLMEVLDTWTTSQPNHMLLSLTAGSIYDVCLGEVIAELVRECSRELAVGYVNEANLPPAHDPLDEFLNEVTDAAIAMATRVVVKETVQEMAGEIMEASAAGAFVLSLIDDLLHDTKDEWIEDVIWEVTVEAAIDELIVLPEVTELAIDAATETLQHYDSKVYRRELKEVKKLGTHKLADSFLLDRLLAMIAHQGHVWTPDELANKALDSAMLSVLLEQLFHVAALRSRTLDNSAMRKLHQRATANVAVDLFLEQLAASLDEDMADIDEYERGITQPLSVDSSIPPSSEKASTVAYSVPSTRSSCSGL